MKQYTKSEQLFKQSKEAIVGGVNSPVRAFLAVERNPVFISKAKGSHIYDVDDNDYIDYVGSWGPAILGHAHEKVIEAVKKASEEGLTFGAPTKKEYQLAKLIQEAMPSMELMRFVSSGTEAVMSAIRVARGYTKRDKIIKFKGCYHGHSDGLLVKAGSAALTNAVPDSGGVPNSYTEHTLIALYNHKETVEQLFECYGEEIAAVVVEPVAANMGVVLPQDGFLTFLREITKKYGSLLIFDEVITGFRLGYGGAQEYYKVKPDLTTLGKIVGGGMPMAVYGGKREIMEVVAPMGNVYQAGTLSGNPIATSAGITTLTLLKETKNLYEQLEEKAKLLVKSFYRYSEKQGVPVHVNQIGSLVCCYFTNQKVEDYDSAVLSDTKQYCHFFQQMLENGIYIAPSQFEAMFLSAAHTMEEIETTCQIIENIH